MAGEPTIVGEGDHWVLRGRLRTPDGITQCVAIYELREGRLAMATEYFAPPLPASPAREPFADRP